MSEKTAGETRLIDKVLSKVKRIVHCKGSLNLKVAALQALTSRLGKMLDRCERRYLQVKSAGNSAVEGALGKRREFLEKAIHYVSSMAASLVQKRSRLSFAFQPQHFAEPRWER